MIRSRCEVLSIRPVGAYWSITLVAPEIAEQARPGQFVEIAVPAGRTFLLRRAFSIHQASRRGGWAGTLEVVFQTVGPGTEWLSGVSPHDTLDVIGPLGRGFQYPQGPASCLLVGGGYGAAPLYFLAEELRSRGKQVHMIIGARDHDRVFKPVEGKRLSQSLAITTEDGSTGERGLVTDLLPTVAERVKPRVIYACGPNVMLRAVGEQAQKLGLPCQVAVEELMACGLGVCWTCVVPVIAKDGRGWWNLRACMEGPVFNAARIWWDRWPATAAEQPPGGGEMVHTPAEGFPPITDPELTESAPR